MNYIKLFNKEKNTPEDSDLMHQPERRNLYFYISKKDYQRRKLDHHSGLFF